MEVLGITCAIVLKGKGKDNGVHGSTSGCPETLASSFQFSLEVPKWPTGPSKTFRPIQCNDSS